MQITWRLRCRSSRISSGRQPSCGEIVLRRHSERIGDAVEESKHRGDINRFGNLLFAPAGVSQFLNIFAGRTISSLGDQFHVIKQRPLGRRETRLIELALENCIDALIGGSLNTQEVSVAVQSIRTVVQE